MDTMKRFMIDVVIENILIAMYNSGTLNVSNIVCVIFCLLAFGFFGISVNKTGCSSGATLNSL